MNKIVTIFTFLATYVVFYLTTDSMAQTINNEHSIEGYSDKISVEPGEAIAFKVHSPESQFSIDFIYYDSFDSEIVKLTVSNISGVEQDFTTDAYRIGANWNTSYSLVIPSNWESGLYAARLFDASGAEFHVTFVIRELQPGENASIAVLASTNTWQAYNAWPTIGSDISPHGKSLYTVEAPNNTSSCDNTNCNPFVSMDRPNEVASPAKLISHLAGAERYILGWLGNNSLDYSMITDWDLHQEPEILKHYPIVIVSTHNEYWTNEMYDGLVHYLDAGGSLLYLSGNGIYWKMTISGNQLEVRKNGDNHQHTGTCGGLWQDTSGPNRPESSVLGVQFDNSGAGCNAGNPNAGPYNILEPLHWVFDGLTLTGSPPQIGVDGFPSLCGVGASGWEMDHINSLFTPANAVHLAKGVNTPQPNGSQSIGADMVYYDHNGGGLVFSAGSIDFGKSLAKDDDVGHLIQNVLLRASGYIVDYDVLGVDGFYVGWVPHFGDFNGDSATDILWDWADEYGRSRNTRHLWLNNGNGSFTLADNNVAGMNGFYFQWKPHIGDFDGDGVDDIMWDWADTFGRSRGVRHLWLNDGTGVFSQESNNLASQNNNFVQRTPHLSDFDQDGAMDILWDLTDEYGRSEGERSLWLNNGSGSFTVTSNDVAGMNGFYFLWKPHVGDFNSDGAADILWDWSDEYGRSRNTRHLWLNNGSGGFTVADTNVASMNGFYFQWKPHIGDFDGDGVDDIMWDWADEFGRSRNTRHLWQNNGNGGFVLASTDVASRNGGYVGWSPTIVDLNGDAKADIVWNEVDTNGLSTGGHRVWETLSFSTFSVMHQIGKANSRPHYANFDNDNRTDVIWDRADTFHRSLGNRDLWINKGISPFPLNYVVTPIGDCVPN